MNTIEMRCIDDPEALGRTPKIDEKRFTLTFPLENGDSLKLHMGREGMNHFESFLAQMMVDDTGGSEKQVGEFLDAFLDLCEESEELRDAIEKDQELVESFGDNHVPPPPQPTGVMCYCCGYESYKNGGKVLCDYCFRCRIEDSKHQCRVESPLEEENQALKDQLEFAKELEKATLPCGHRSQYGFTDDGGKTGSCTLCERDKLREVLMEYRDSVLSHGLHCKDRMRCRICIKADLLLSRERGGEGV